MKKKTTEISDVGTVASFRRQTEQRKIYAFHIIPKIIQTSW